eukprot:658954-Prymnesium_polylepis.1
MRTPPDRALLLRTFRLIHGQSAQRVTLSHTRSRHAGRRPAWRRASRTHRSPRAARRGGLRLCPSSRRRPRRLHTETRRGSRLALLARWCGAWPGGYMPSHANELRRIHLSEAASGW